MTTLDSGLDPHIAHRLDVLTAAAQRDWRSPGVSAGVVVDGRLAWSAHVGAARLDPAGSAGSAGPADDDTQVMIGSITKTFTAILVLQLRDEGRLTLDGRVLTPPYRISAICEAHTLSGAMAIAGWFSDSLRGAGASVDVVESDELLVDALHEPQTPRYARPVEPTDEP